MASSAVARHCTSISPVFPDMGTEPWTSKDKECFSSPQRVMRNGTVVFRVQVKCGVEDLDVMHYQPNDDRLGEVFPSNRPHVEHQGFFNEDTVLKNRRLVAQFVMTRATSSRCEKALSGARCATRYMLRRRSTRR